MIEIKDLLLRFSKILLSSEITKEKIFIELNNILGKKSPEDIR